MYQLVTLGRLTLSCPDQGAPAAVLARKALGLLAILAARGPTSRDQVMALLWPESDLNHARGSLKKAIHQLRQQLGTSQVVRGTELLELDPAVIDSDIARFHAALAAGDPARAESAYGGPFLDGAHLQGSVELEHWIDATRTDLQAAWAEAIERLATQAEAEDAWPVAAAQWRRLQETSPADSRLALRLMRALDAAGQPGAALAHAKAHRRGLQQQWDLPPDAAVEALAQELRTRPPSDPGTLPPSRVVTGRMPPTSGAPAVARSARQRGARAIVATALVGVIALTTVALRAHLDAGSDEVGDPNLLAITPFEVADTSLVLWREGLPALLVRALDGAGPLRAVRASSVLQDGQGKTDRESLARLAARFRAGLVLTGGMARTGVDSVLLTGRVLDREANAVVADVGVRGPEGRIDELTDSLVLHLLRSMGRGRAIAATPRVSLVARSLPALREFLRGEQFFRRDQVDSAMAHYHQAIVEDSGLAMAHRRLGWLIAANADVGAAYGSWKAVVTRAIALNHGLDPRDSLLLLADSLMLAQDRSLSPETVMRDRFTRASLLEEAGRRFPFDAALWAELGEARLHEPSALSDTPADPLAAFQRAMELDPGYAPGYWHAVDLAFRSRQPGLAAWYARAASRLNPNGEPGSMALTSLVLDSGLTASSTQRALATASPRALQEAGMAHLAWAADSAEAAIAILREFTGRDDPVALASTRDPRLRYRFLAGALAFRGHLRAAAATGLVRATDPTAKGVDAWNDPFTDLALLGAVPDSFARLEYARAFDENISWGVLVNADGIQRQLRGVPWWYARGDTASLRRFAARAAAVAAAPGTPVARLRGRYYAGIAPAWLALARGDSASALRRLEAVPDSLCIAAPCIPDKRLLAQLLSASGDDRRAARVLDRWSPTIFVSSPSAVLIELERGRIAERLADAVRARRAYGFVVDVWRNADPELAGYVQTAREGLNRLANRSR